MSSINHSQILIFFAIKLSSPGDLLLFTASVIEASEKVWTGVIVYNLAI